MSESQIEKLQSVARQLEHLSIRLGASVPPGHVNYISKPLASSWARVLCEDIRKLLILQKREMLAILEESDINRDEYDRSTGKTLDGIERNRQ